VAVSAQQAIDTTNRIFGRHPGVRALHAKGTVCRGSFLPTAEAAALCRAGHFSGPEVPATIRFSNGSGNPEEPDGVPGPRGLALKLYLPDGSRTDIVSVSNPRFPTRTPEGFLELMEAQAAGPAALWKLPLFLRHHPEAITVLPAVATTLKPPVSYATIPYYGLHAYKWIDAGGGERYVRYILRPAAGTARLSILGARRRPPDYLQQDILARIQADAVVFSLEVQIAGPEDPTDDPSAAWPRQRQRVTVGTLRITGPDHEREQGDDVLVFDPSRVTDGIECSEDPVLRFRPEAYSESVKRRTGG
jgi:catalase